MVLAIRAALVDALRIFLLAATIGGAMVSGLYVAANDARADLRSVELRPEVELAVGAGSVGAGLEDPALAPADLADEIVADELAADAFAEEIPEGVDPPEEVAALVDLYAEEILDEETGLRFGLTIVPSTEVAILEPDVVSRAVGVSRSGSRATRAVRARPAVEPIPRLSADPGRHVILTARGMMSRNETVRGSCYAYLSEVFSRAGHEGWRTRTIVHRSGREGPYANLDLIRPGDWLYIVNHPEATPVGTHSVLFVGWEDRARGYARVIEHSGWGAGPSAGQERGYDVSRTYRIVRPILPR